MSEKKKLKVCKDCALGPLTPIERSKKAYCIRKCAAKFQKDLPLPMQKCNGDEKRYKSKIANFSKALPHNYLGEVDLCAYDVFLDALDSGKPCAFEEIPLGGERKLVNPQAAYAYDLIGPDSHHLFVPPAPKFSSAWMGVEMAEVYWRAITRDVPFIEYDESALTNEAADDLSKFSEYHGPKHCGEVTTGTLFRGNAKGNLTGPYISQFLYKDIPYGAKTVTQQYRAPMPDENYMVSYDDWLYIQNGGFPPTNDDTMRYHNQGGLNCSPNYDDKSRYIYSGRVMGEFVHVDFIYQAVLGACLILLGYGEDALSPTNPYLYSKTQYGFATFGDAHVLDFVAKSARVALEAAWFQKFLVHRRLRPEAYGGCVHNNLTGKTEYPISQELLDSPCLEYVYDRYGTYLLPMAYPEGSPTHPSYPAGHASMVGAGVTMLKAFFNEHFKIPETVQANADGLALLPYDGCPLCVWGELNKLGSNIALGRDTAGVHYRSDGYQGLRLGEAVAIGILHDFKKTYNECFEGFCLTKFDGTTIII